jgi:chromosome segregation ATPase
MDIETHEAIETLRADIRRVEETLGARIDAQGNRLDAVEASLRAEMREIRAEMRETREELTRHSQVLFESLRDDIHVIADGLVSLDAKVESLRRPNDPR